ncbi:MAG: hypothetical protein J6386_09255 [Candidatus Synoicihabitans palmerolidicus]|nr:hypothetical protein [Candidatus Synoicihabitans palmerolidicus]
MNLRSDIHAFGSVSVGPQEKIGRARRVRRCERGRTQVAHDREASGGSLRVTIRHANGRNRHSCLATVEPNTLDWRILRFALPSCRLISLARVIACLLGCFGLTPRGEAAAADTEAGLPFLTTCTPRDYRGHSQMWSIAEDINGMLYFGNLNAVLVFDGARWTKVDVPGATFVRGIAIDQDDTLWIGGVDELGYAATSPTGERTFVSLEEKGPAEARDFGAIWRVLATQGGVLFHAANALLHWDSTRVTALTLPNKGRHNMVRVGNDIWLTNANNDWHRFNNPQSSSRELRPLPQPPELRGARIIGAAASTDNSTVVVATDQQGLWRWDGEAFSAFSTSVDASLKEESIYGLTGLPDGCFAVHSLFRGLQRFDANGRLHLTLNDQSGLPNKTVICAMPTRDGQALWLGTANGIVRMDLRTWVSEFNVLNGAPAAKISAAIRLRNELYLPSASAGLRRLVPAEGTASAHLVREDSVDDLVNSATPLQQTLMLGTTNGFREWDGLPFYLACPTARLTRGRSCLFVFNPVHGPPSTATPCGAIVMTTLNGRRPVHSRASNGCAISWRTLTVPW